MLTRSQLEAYAANHVPGERDVFTSYAYTALHARDADARAFLVAQIPTGVVPRNAAGLTNFHLAVLSGDSAHVDLAVGAQQDVHAYWQNHDLLRIAHLTGERQTLEQCFEHGFSPRVFDTPRDVYSIELADLTTAHHVNETGKAPTPAKVLGLAGATRNRSVATHIVRSFIKPRMIDVKKLGMNAFHVAAITGDERFLAKGDSKSQDAAQVPTHAAGAFHQRNAFTLALEFGHFAIADAVLDRMASLRDDEAMLTLLVEGGHVDALAYLKQKGRGFDDLNTGRFFLFPNPETIDSIVGLGWDIHRTDAAAKSIATHLLYKKDRATPACYRKLLDLGLRLVTERNGKHNSAMLDLIGVYKMYKNHGLEDVYAEIFTLFVESGQIDPNQSIAKRDVRTEVLNRLPATYAERLEARRIPSSEPITLDPHAAGFEEKYLRLKNQGIAIRVAVRRAITALAGQEDPAFLLAVLETQDLSTFNSTSGVDIFSSYILDAGSRYVRDPFGTHLSTDVLDWFAKRGFSANATYAKELEAFEDPYHGRVFTTHRKECTALAHLAAVKRGSMPSMEEHARKSGNFDAFLRHLAALEEDDSLTEALNEAARAERLRALPAYSEDPTAVLGFGIAVADSTPVAVRDLDALGLLCIDYRNTSGVPLTLLSNHDRDAKVDAPACFLGVELLRADTDGPTSAPPRALLDGAARFDAIPEEFWSQAEELLGGVKGAPRGFYAQCIGPLASGQLVVGSLERDPGEHERVHRGSNLEQNPQETAAVGERIAVFDTRPVHVQIEETRDGSYCLIASYD